MIYFDDIYILPASKIDSLAWPPNVPGEPEPAHAAPVPPPGWVVVAKRKFKKGEWTLNACGDVGGPAPDDSECLVVPILSRISCPGGKLEEDWVGMEGWEAVEYAVPAGQGDGFVTDGGVVCGCRTGSAETIDSGRRWILRQKPAAKTTHGPREAAAPVPSPEKLADALRQGYEYTGEYGHGEAGSYTDSCTHNTPDICCPCGPVGAPQNGMWFLLRRLPVLDPIPAGYRVVGFRLPKEGETYLSQISGRPELSDLDWGPADGASFQPHPWWAGRRHILEKIEPPKPAERPYAPPCEAPAGYRWAGEKRRPGKDECWWFMAGPKVAIGDAGCHPNCSHHILIPIEPRPAEPAKAKTTIGWVITNMWVDGGLMIPDLPDAIDSALAEAEARGWEAGLEDAAKFACGNFLPDAASKIRSLKSKGRKPC